MSIDLRPLVEFPAHIAVVASWVHEEWKQHSGVSLRETKARLLHPANSPHSLVALSNASPVGVVGFRRFMRQGQDAMDLFINVLFVQKEQRNRGIGRTLLREALALAATQVSTLYVYTDVQAWYEKTGWLHSPSCRCEDGSCVLFYDLGALPS